MMQVDGPHVVVPGSRWPISVSKARLVDTAPPIPTHNIFPTPLAKLTSALAATSSISRRKPRVTFRSPDSDSPLLVEWPLRTGKTPTITPQSINPTPTLSETPPTHIFTTSTPKRETSPVFTPAPPLFKMRPPLPAYHPLGPRVEATLLEASNPYTPKPAGRDVSHLMDDSDSRRSSSRTRKPAAKLRDSDDHPGQDRYALLPTPAAATVSTSTRGGASPQKRKRANGAGNAARKKRKDAATADRDGTYPNRKARPSRNAAAPTHSGNDVADPDGAPSPTDSNIPVSDGGGAEEKDPEVDVDPAVPARKPAARTRRPRQAATVNMKRRWSSASEATTTSVSVSIAGAIATSGKDKVGALEE
ncbi:hypothetical protein BD410DRAFT_559856 [Rickenella mellea]|uniref:Uncharacterized protein n=1 Tax=Rickenella mellea TaxID=50990 RepID=A0A4Y7QGJ1_9AGAM|nr:hypothetical protein BD410DRAFT_559856 [Rickenella mellea]